MASISIGNGNGGIWIDGRQLICSCGNTTLWRGVRTANNSASATCSLCGNTATL